MRKLIITAAVAALTACSARYPDTGNRPQPTPTDTSMITPTQRVR